MIRETFEQARQNLELVLRSDYLAGVERAADLLAEAFHSGRKLLVFGNGGSAADAQHISGELVGRFLRERAGLPAIALAANPAVLTAWSNDYSFETVFARQIEALGVAGDVAWGISTSGNSPNVLRALETASRLGLRTIGLAGEGGGRMARWCEVLMAAPARETPRIQEIHLVSFHAICQFVEERLFERLSASCEESTAALTAV